jgi:hypothetical protein
METEKQKECESEDLDGSETNGANWRMPIREQARLHQSLLRRRAQHGVDNKEDDSTLVFIESAADAGPLFFSHTADYAPLRESAE